jgi:tetratricopeptide (TPR) repeat protein
MYLQYKRFDEAAEQYQRAVALTHEKVDLTLRLTECYVQAGQRDKAIRELKALISVEPRLAAPRLKLGLILYNSHHIAEAVDQWENILRFEPKNQEALRYLKMAQAAGVTTLGI